MILGALFAVLVASVVWNFSGSSASAPPSSSAAKNAPRDPNRVRNVDLQKGTNAGGAIGPAGTSDGEVVALNINEIAPPVSDLAVKRNPFAYPPPPPPRP